MYTERTRQSQGDEDWSRRLQEVEDAGEVIRFIGSYDAESGVCQVLLRIGL